MKWSAGEINELLGELRARGQDFVDVEVKLGSGGLPHVGDTLCAFGNMPGGGTLIVGLDEANGFAAVGVEDPATIEQGIASTARNAVVPPVQVSCEEAVIDGRTVVIATVSPLPVHQRPALYQGRAYLRQADGDYPMSELEVQQLLARRERPRFDVEEVPGTSVGDLDRGILEEFLQQARASSRRLAGEADDVVLRRKRVVGPGGMLTVAGLYALGQYPQEFLPSLSITAAVLLDPRSGQRARDRVDLDGPLPVMLDDAMTWVTRNTMTTIRFGPDGHADDANEIPLVAVRELIANALVHRDLGPHTRNQRVEIRLRSEELFVNSPGGLYGLSVPQLGTDLGKSAVNEHLYDICKLLRTPARHRVIEGEGGGIREVRRVLRAANMRPPRFVDSGVRFTVFLPRYSLLEPTDLGWLADVDPTGALTPVQRQIAVSLRHGQRWTNALVRSEFGPIDSRDATSALQGLVGLGIAITQGERGQTDYVLAPTHEPVDPPSASIVEIREPGQDGSPEQDPLPADVSETGGVAVGARAVADPGTVSKNSGAIWSALRSGPRTLLELQTDTGLTPRQTQYALERLRAAGLVTTSGGRGRRDTTYARRGSQ